MLDAAEKDTMIRWWEVRGPAQGPISPQDGWFGSYASDCPQTAHPESVRVRYVVSPDVGHHFCAAARQHKLSALDVQATWAEGERPSDDEVDVWQDLLLRCDVPDEHFVDRRALIHRYDENADQMVFKAGWDASFIGEYDLVEHPDDGEQEAVESAFADWGV